MKYNRREMMALLGASALAGGRGFAAEGVKKTYGIALVGLGSYSKGQLGPALLGTNNAMLTMDSVDLWVMRR